MPPTLYLFQSTSDAFYAVARAQTGCSIPKLNNGDGWLLRGEIRFDDLPADVVVTTKTWLKRCLNGDFAVRNGSILAWSSSSMACEKPVPTWPAYRRAERHDRGHVLRTGQHHQQRRLLGSLRFGQGRA